MIFPDKLKKGDEIRVIAPSSSLGIISDENIQLAAKALEDKGFKVTFSKNAKEMDMFDSSSVESRVNDLHDAFQDKNVKAILAVIGGFNVNQILGDIDYQLIKDNPKIICGYSDITALSNAITAKTGLVTYSGMCFSTFAMQKETEYSNEYFGKCLIESEPFIVEDSKTWSDDEWYLDQENRILEKNTGPYIIQPGNITGTIVGGNLCTLNLLQGTEYMPSLENTILFLEDDYEVDAQTFDRDLQSLMHMSEFKGVRGIVIGRFQKESQVSKESLLHIIKAKKKLRNIPIIANVDFGHTSPMITFPIGGTASLTASKEDVVLKIINH